MAESTELIAGTKFPMARGDGYDVDQVDDYVEGRQSLLVEQVDAAETELDSLPELRSEAEYLRELVAETENPTFEGMARRAARILAQAEAKADATIAEANRGADDIRQLAKQEAGEQREEIIAQAGADERQEMEAERERLYAEAERDRTSARAEAEEMVNKAREDAARVRSQAKETADERLAEAKADAERTRDGADREITEARDALAAVQERAAGESGAGHEAASKLAERLVDAAEARAETAQQLAGETSAATERRRELADSEAAEIVADAHREADRIANAAKARAEVAFQDAVAAVEQELATAQADLEFYQARYDAVAAQFAQVGQVSTALAAAASH